MKYIGMANGIATQREAKDHQVMEMPLAIIVFSSAVTFMAFFLLDPHPSLLLSFCMAANVGIILSALYRFYRKEMLLSPMAAIFAGCGMFFLYSWGNLGARIIGEGRFGSNPGSLEYYPLAALLSTIGLGIFLFIVFAFNQEHIKNRVRYNDLYWKPWQAPLSAIVALVLLLYLSSKYPFENGYFREVENFFDQWLCATQYFFISLAELISVSVIVKSAKRKDRLIGVAGLIFTLLMPIGMRSRTWMMQVVILGMVSFVTLKPWRLARVLLCGTIIAVLIFAYGTVVKSYSSKTRSIYENMKKAQDSDMTTINETNRELGYIDYQYRIAGLEYPAIILKCLDNGASPMYGEGIFGGAMQALPNFLRPEGKYSERASIYNHYSEKGLRYSDSIGIPLTSGVADWGYLGPLIYAVMAGYCLLMWRVMQSSPYFFLAFLMIGPPITDLFWDTGLFAIRGVAFALLSLILLGPVVMPRWIPKSEDSTPALHRSWPFPRPSGAEFKSSL